MSGSIDVRGRLLTAAAVWALAAAAAQAQQMPAEPADADTAEVEQVVVTATRTEKTEATAPATVTAITAREIEDQLATDIKDLVRFEPGVSVRSSPARFGAAFGTTGRDGNAGFNIRGLEGNRVLIQVDGVRVPEGFTFGAQAVGRGDYVDLDLLKSVEILRGPASALYGSDGVAGAVSFVTKDPLDLLEPGRSFTTRARVAYAEADDSLATGLAVAGRTGRVSALLAYTRRDAGEQETQGTIDVPDVRRTVANPQDIETDSVLAKLVFEPAEGHRLRLIYDGLRRTVETEVFSGRAAPPPPTLGPTAVIDLDAVDETERDRVALDYRYDGGGPVERGQVIVFLQDSTTVEFSDEDRLTAVDRTRLNTFNNRIVGLNAQGESALTLGGLRHRLLYGGDGSLTRQEGVRDGTVPPAGETFPTRAFPNTDYTLAGLFIQDEISLLDGALTLYPALRYDAYELEPEADPLFPGRSAGSSGSELSPKFAVVWFPTRTVGLFFNFAEGYKAPSPSQVNNGFINVAGNYLSLPNPDLRPETSRSYELGLRLRDRTLAGGRFSGALTAFQADYENFVEQIQVSGSFRPTDPSVFQFVNLSAVDIHGLEGRLEGRWANGFGVLAAASYARGDQTTRGVTTALASVDPLKVVAGLDYRHPGGRWGGQLTATYSREKEADRTGLICAGGCYTPDGFTVLDATAYVNLTKRVILRAAVFNLTDETYSWWSDVRGLSATSTVLDAYTQPGRTFSLSLAAKF